MAESLSMTSRDKYMIMSEDMKDQNEQEMENPSNETVQEQDTEATQESKEPTAEERYAELNNKYIRIHAEFDNYRKRTNKEKLDTINSTNDGVLKDMLPVLDDFERAITNNETVEDAAAIKEGFNLIFNKFRSIMESKGIKEMKTKGEPFDSEIHEAIANVPAPKKKDKGKVIEAVEKGYYLNDKVIRYAKVVGGQ